jgi:hypothetical protein
MYFKMGGGTVKGISKPGEIVWSRIFIDAGILKADIGRARSWNCGRGTSAVGSHHSSVAHHAHGDVRHRGIGLWLVTSRTTSTWRIPRLPTLTGRWP